MIFFSLSSSTVGRKLSLRSRYRFFSSFCFFSSAGDWPVSEHQRMKNTITPNIKLFCTLPQDLKCFKKLWIVLKDNVLYVLLRMFLSTSSSAVGRMDSRRMSRAPIASHDSCLSCSLCTTRMFLRTN